MPLTKISTSHQITIPKQVFDDLNLRPGDIVEVVSNGDEAVLIPKRVVAAKPMASLSEAEQEILPTVKQKIEAISTDLINSKGLTRDEAEVAAKVGLIDPAQRWWYLEDWQKGEREAERDIRDGKVLGPFASVEEFKQALKERKRASL